MDASLGKITSYTMLSCTVTCSRQNPACAVQCCAYMRSTVQYSTGQIWNVKATFVFPFRSSRKMPLSQSLEKLTFFAWRGGGNQMINDWLIDCFISGLRNWLAIVKKMLARSNFANIESATSGDARKLSARKRDQSLTFSWLIIN